MSGHGKGKGVLVCRTGGPGTGPHEAGTTIDLCADCGATVAIAQNALPILALGVRALCLDCGTAVMEKDERSGKASPTSSS